MPEFKGIWDPEAAVEAGGGGSKYAASLSKLEQQYLKAAMDRKKAGYGWIEKQVRWPSLKAGVSLSSIKALLRSIEPLLSVE